MRYSSALFALAAPLLVSAAPARFLGKRAAADILVLQFAEVLENLESTFYEQALSKFKDSDFTSAGFLSGQLPVEQFKVIQADEAAHAKALQSALKAAGKSPVPGCKFNFDSALVDVATMAATARVVEAVGVSAYLGGATLLTDPVLLAAAGSILTIEARHQTVLNILSGTGSAVPAAFDIGLTPNEVLALASPFISGCDVGIPANTPLTVTNTGPVAPGTALTFKADSINGTIPEDKLFCQMLTGGAPFSIALPFSQCVVPQDINGPVAIFITSDGQPLLNNVRDRAQTQIIAGPTYAFIDTQPQTLGQLIRGAGGSQNVTLTSTATISPAEASSIISSVQATSTTESASSSPSSGPPQATDTGATTPAPAPAPSTTPTTPASASSTAPPGPNMSTGPSADGKITVNGWSGLGP